MLLQRSHALSGVETVPYAVTRCIVAAPSTKPRPFRRGDPATRSLLSLEKAFLQRSHALSGVETAARPGTRNGRGGSFNEATPFQAWRPPDSTGKRRPPRSTLQRSHALSGVETSPRPTSMEKCISTFNEATPFQAWRPYIIGNKIRRQVRPSTKPRPFRRGDGRGQGKRPLRDGPSTKPRPFRRGDRRPLRSAGCRGHFREPPSRDPQGRESRACLAFPAETLSGGESRSSTPFECLRDEVSPPRLSHALST